MNWLSGTYLTRKIIQEREIHEKAKLGREEEEGVTRSYSETKKKTKQKWS